jgi:hypothetical protein
VIFSNSVPSLLSAWSRWAISCLING